MNFKKYIKNINLIKNNYELSLYSSSITFYMIVTIFSLFILILQFYNYFNNKLLLNSIINYLNIYYVTYFENIVPIFSLDKLSPLLFINLIWSSSKYINGFNRVSDIIYKEKKKRNWIINRISSIIILFLIIISLIFEVFLILFFDNIIIQFLGEFILIYTIVIILNYSIPPVKLKLRNIYFGSFVSTVFIYIILIIFLLLIKVMNYLNLNIISILSLFLLFIYCLNYALVIGIYINYAMKK